MVHATVVEVVVLSFIGDHRSGSGSRGSRRLVENHGGGSRTHVVEELGLAKRYLTVVVLDAKHTSCRGTRLAAIQGRGTGT